MTTTGKSRKASNIAASLLTLLLALVTVWMFGSGVLDPRSPNYRAFPGASPEQDPISAAIGDANAHSHKVRTEKNPKTDFALTDPGVVIGDTLTPARWCPQTIEYSIDFTGLDPYAAPGTQRREKQRWARAFAAWERASKGAYRFTFAGQRTHIITTGDDALSYVTNIAPDTIAITYGAVAHPDARYKDIHLTGALAHAGFQKPQWPNNKSGNPAAYGHIGGAAITVDAADLQDPRSTRAPRVHVHEIGHALGLGHVNNPDSVMHVKNQGPRLPQPGDIRGIERLLSVGCR